MVAGPTTERAEGCSEANNMSRAQDISKVDMLRLLKLRGLRLKKKVVEREAR